VVVIAALLVRWLGSLDIPDGEPVTARGSS